ncbi:MAG: hypothetical protein R3C11_09900 [Planctomycetaceae bacterium]
MLLEEGVDNAKSYVLLEEFSKETPLASISHLDNYSGDFPSPLSSCKYENCSEYEFSLDYDWSNKKLPLWCTKHSRKQLFQTLLEKDDMQGAWLTLNSTGWSISDSKKAIKSLVQKTEDSGFKILAEAWLKSADKMFGGY